MIVRIVLAILLAASFAFVAAPAPAVAESCETCPAPGGDAEDCADDCPLCVCCPHRAPMGSPPAVPDVALFSVTEFTHSSDTATLSPVVRDILHVPRLHPAVPQI